MFEESYCFRQKANKKMKKSYLKSLKYRIEVVRIEAVEQCDNAIL